MKKTNRIKNKRRLHPLEIAARNASFDIMAFIQKKWKEAIIKQRRNMITIQCKCGLCAQDGTGHWHCQRFQDNTTSENVELCKQNPIAE